MPRTRPALPDLDATMQLVTRFEAAADPALQDAELDTLLRHVPDKRAILSGRWQGRAAIFRIFLDPSDPAPAREWDEMNRIWPAMRTGPWRIAEPLHYCAPHGILVIEAVAGTPLMQHLWRSDPPDRAAHLRPAAQWLRAYTQGTDTPMKTRAGVWLNRAEQAAARQPHPRLQRREARILEHLHRLAPLCDNTVWRNAISHGDFHPNNLIWNDGRYTGIDTGGSAAMPIYKDMARFLMHMGRRGLLPSGEAQFGVDRTGLAAFAAAFDLSENERNLILPFMLGCEALLRVETADIKSGRIHRACEMSDHLIADLAQV